MSERVHSIETLRTEFAGLLTEYMQHLEPTAPLDVQAIRFEASGAGLSMSIYLPATGPPYMQITLSQRDDDGAPVEPARGSSLFGRRQS
jgi:hypothetical protein